jgi:hypothetical protein
MLLDALRQLWPVAAALALLDAVAWVRAGRRLFVSWLRPVGGRWMMRRPGPSFAGVLPASREAAVGPALVLPAADGVYLLLDPREADGPRQFQPDSWTLVPWSADLVLEAEGAELQVGDHRLDLGSAGEAAARCAALTALLDRAGAERRRQAFEAAVAPAVAWGWAFFALLFGAFPVALYLLPPPPVRAVAALLAALALAYGAALASAIRAGRRLRREGVLPAGGTIAPLLLAPPAIVRAAAVLGRDLYHGCDPLAVAALLLPRAALLHLAGAELHGAAAAARPEAGGGDGWRQAWQRRRAAILALLREAGIAEADVLAPPPRRDPAAAAWCPLCGAEVQEETAAREGAMDCPDCALPLMQYPRTA